MMEEKKQNKGTEEKKQEGKDWDPNTRGKQAEKFPTSVGTREFYKHYRNKYVEKKGDAYDISRGIYLNICKEFNQAYMDKALFNAEDIKLPCRLGYLGVRKYKKKFVFDEDGNIIKGMPVDWKRTKDLWYRDPEARRQRKVVYHDNWRSDDYLAMFKWFKRTAIFPNASMYRFIVTRTNKRTLSAIMKNNKEYRHINYYEVDY